MDGFKHTPRQTGIAISGGDRVNGPGGSRSRSVARPKPSTSLPRRALIQASSGERSFTITTASVENLPIADRNFASLTHVDAGRHPAPTTRLGGGGQNNIMMDGVSTMDTGNNGQMLQMNVEAIAEVEGSDLRLPGRVRPLERPADHRRHQERHQPDPRLVL